MQLLPVVAALSWWSCLDVGDELVHQARDEPDRADRLAVSNQPAGTTTGLATVAST
jgi:hypothetical protein